MSRHSCKDLGCVQVGDDRECIVCDQVITNETLIYEQVPRRRPHIDLGELRGPGAMAYDFGPADLNGEHFA